MTAIYLTHAAELFTKSGPTGRFVEVVAGDVRDHGGNVLFSGSADACAAESRKYRIPVRLVPTEWREVAGEMAGADVTWQLVMA